MGNDSAYLILGLLVFAVIFLMMAMRIIQQYEKGIILRLGRYSRTVTSGVTFVLPFIEAVIKVDMREKLIEVPPQKVITKDNVTVLVDAVIYYKVVDPIKAEFEVVDFGMACTTLAQTNLRNLIGDQQLDETLTARDKINVNLREVLDHATDTWGVKVTRVEVQKIDPPSDITEAMSKQMKAEREKRAAILEAEGIKQSEILKAEGAKQGAILTAEGEAQAKILRADADAKAIETVAVSAEKFFQSRAETYKKLDVIQSSLSHNTKLILPTNSPLLNILGLDDKAMDK